MNNKINHNNYNMIWASLIVEELVRNGIDYFCISPGSRSTPLAYAVANNPKAESIVCYDERGGGFHAVGYARGAGKPAVLICTSGTAVANYMPAVIEADADYIPMIILSADRPPELQSTGANQTINQPDLFGPYSRWKFNLPCPDANIDPAFVLTTMGQAVFMAVNSPAGPVHINCMFREPLMTGNDKISANYLENINNWTESNIPYTKYHTGHNELSDIDFEEISDELFETDKGIIIAGCLSSRNQAVAIEEFSNLFDWPIFPDVLSGLRFKNSKNAINYFDQILLSESSLKYAPEFVLHFGGRPASKRLLEYLNKIRPKKYILVADRPHRLDPNHIVTGRIQADIESFCYDIADADMRIPNHSFLQYWKNSTDIIHNLLKDYISKSSAINEIQIANIISEMIPVTEGLFLASSMPIRDMDMYGTASNKYSNIAGNRGASGIDGVIASASGFARGLNSGITLVTGDLSALHDINSLDLLSKCGQRVTIIIINNGGGGIFSFLPISENNDAFDKFWTTSHNYRFENFAKGFGIDYRHCNKPNKLADLYKKALNSDHSMIIEVTIDRNNNVTVHNDLQTLIKNEIDKIHGR